MISTRLLAHKIRRHSLPKLIVSWRHTCKGTSRDDQVLENEELEDDQELESDPELEDVQEPEGDQEFQNHCLFLQHTLNYLLLKYAIKHADLGLLRRAIDKACCLFSGSSHRKYAHEMLQFQKLLTTSASPTLQRAILANNLVNFRGSHDSWFETDRMMEFHIGNMKDIFRAKRGSCSHLNHCFHLKEQRR